MGNVLLRVRRTSNRGLESPIVCQEFVGSNTVSEAPVRRVIADRCSTAEGSLQKEYDDQDYEYGFYERTEGFSEPRDELPDQQSESVEVFCWRGRPAIHSGSRTSGS